MTLRNETSYLRLVFEESKLIGVGMINLKEHAKTLERALNEHWSKDQAQAFFSLFQLIMHGEAFDVLLVNFVLKVFLSLHIESQLICN